MARVGIECYLRTFRDETGGMDRSAYGRQTKFAGGNGEMVAGPAIVKDNPRNGWQQRDKSRSGKGRNQNIPGMDIDW